MKNAIKTVLLAAALTAAIIVITACNKKGNDQSAQLAELNAKLEAMQAQLDAAKSGNAMPEEIAELEAAAAEAAQQEQSAQSAMAEQQTERRREKRSIYPQEPPPLRTPRIIGIQQLPA
jgi:septal ring factor EnvC (AmiA/AmiB activator)